MFRRNGKRRAARGTRVVFATDIHGSEDCFRKFLNSARVYEASILILGGDILGKRLVPILQDANGTYRCTYGNESVDGLDERGRVELTRKIRRFGDYVVVGNADELARLHDETERDRMFREAVYQSVTDWVTLADERLKGSGLRCFVAPGNDDFLEIDSALLGSECLEFAENRCIQIDGKYDMITTGYSNPTPWLTERELPEEELGQRLKAMARSASSTVNMIVVAHAPPFDSALDQAPALNEEFAMKVNAAVGVVMKPVGSVAVRDFVETTQPLLGLHGHVHESGGAVHIGRTLCLNPGSLYARGVLNAALVELGEGEVLSHQFVSG